MNFKKVMTTSKHKVDELKEGLARFGPASIAVNVDKKSFKFFSKGVYDDPECSKLKIMT